MLSLHINSNQLSHSFDRIAQDLFERFYLRIGAKDYYLTEVEFYYYEYNKVVDNFAHKHGNEYPNATWRLHGAGVDIVLKGANYYGGILLRGMESTEDQHIDGPWKLASTCLRNKGSIHTKTGFHLAEAKIATPRPFKKAPRVGLFLKDAADLDYWGRPWRYSTSPLKTKNCRHLLFLQLYLQGDTAWQALGLGQRARNNYLQYFESAQQVSLEQLISTPKSIKKDCQLFSHYVQKFGLL